MLLSDRVEATGSPAGLGQEGSFGSCGAQRALHRELAGGPIPGLPRRAHVCSLLESFVENLPDGVLLMDRKQHVFWANREALRILRSGAPVKISRAGFLRARSDIDDEALLAWLKRAWEQEASHRPLKLGGLVIHGSTFFREERRDELLSIVIADTQRPVRCDGDALTSVYGLTATEAKLSLKLADGYSLGDAAAALGIRIETARSHLKHVFSKTRTNRQGELIRTLMAGFGSTPIPERSLRARTSRKSTGD